MSRVFDRASGDLAPGVVDRLRRVLRGGNMRHGVAATCAAMLLFPPLPLGEGPGARAYGIAQPLAPTRSADPILQTDDLPDAAAVAEAFLRARRWVDSFDPPAFDDAASRLAIDNATGVCVILRSARRVVGTGTATLGADSAPDLLLRRAVGRALADALGDPALAALPEERRDEIGSSLSLELEIAGQLQPLLGRDFHRIAQQIEPGLDGVAMRRGDSRAMTFPSQLRAANAAGNIQSRLPGLATELGFAAADLASLQARHNVSMHRFRTTHLAQSAPNGFPFETFRGDRIVSLHEVTRESIAAFADALAEHLLGRLWNRSDRHHANAEALRDGRSSPPRPLTVSPSQETPLALGMRGDYDPIGDTYRPIFAPPLDQALAALALMRYSNSLDADGAIADRARSAAATILVELETVEDGEIDPLLDPAACAVISMILAEHPGLAREDEAIERLGRGAKDVVHSAFDLEMGYTFDERNLPPHTQALLAADIAHRLSQRDAAIKPVDLDLARGAIDSAWASVSPQQHVTLLPWIGWAEIAYAQAAREPVANADALRSIRAALHEASALAAADLEPDLAGGFPLAVGDAAGDRPTAQTSRPAAFFATMLRHPDLTHDDEHDAASERHRRTMRFLMQLSVRESSTWSMRSQAAALGGIRASAWDSRMPTAAQALALLAAVESLSEPR